MKLHQQRTCLGCRTKTSSNELIRWVIQPDTANNLVRLAVQRSAPGRGAWTHPIQKCVQQAVHRKGFARAFRTVVNDSQVLSDFAAHEDRLATGQSSGRKKESGSEI